MKYSLRKLSKALLINEPVTLEECLKQLRIDIEDSDGLIESDLIITQMIGAREKCEDFLGVSLALKSYEASYESFPKLFNKDSYFELPFGPVQSITSVTYGIDNTLISPDDYTLDQGTNKLYPNVSWPTIEKGSVKIRYEAGHGIADSDYPDLTLVDNSVKIAILYTMSHYHENREDVTDKQFHNLPNGAQSILRPLRERLGMA